MEQKIAKKWRNCAFQAMFIIGLCGSSASIIAPLLQEHWNLTYSTVGNLLSLVVVGNVLASFLIGILPGFMGERNANLLLAIGTSMGYLLMAVTGNPLLLGLGFLLIGMAKGGTLNTGTLLIKRSTPRPTQYNNLMHACFATGALLCPFVVAIFDRSLWWLPMVALGCIGTLQFMAFLFAGLPTEKATKAQKQGQWDFLRNRFFWLLAATLFCQCASEQAVTNWVVTYFKDSGILSGTLSNLTVTVIWSAMLCARLVIAFLLKFKDNFKVLAVMTAGSFATLLLLLNCRSGGAALGALFLFGLCVAGTNPTLVASTGSLMSGAALGVLMPVGSMGAVIMPIIIGNVAQAAGLEAGMACPLVSFALMFVLTLLCRREAKKQNIQ